jgi:predicted Abi (CAAX) family protease
MSYTELQAALKDLRDNHGVELQTKLAGKGVTKEVLQAEYDRVTQQVDETPSKEVETVLEPVKLVVAHSFKAMVPAQRQRKAKGFTVKSRKVSWKGLHQLFEDLQALSQLTLTSHR